LTKGLRIDLSSSGIAPVSADWLIGRLLIDVLADSRQKTSRLAQATELMQSLYFALRNHGLEQLSPRPDVASWTLTEAGGQFDDEWTWIGTYSNWQSIMRVFLYPENTLLPTLRLDASLPVPDETTTEPAIIGERTQAFDSLVGRLDADSYGILTSQQALIEANSYLTDLRARDKNNNSLYPSIPPELQALPAHPGQPPPPYLYVPNLQQYPDPRALNIAQQLQHSKSSLSNYYSQSPTNWTIVAYLWEAWYFVPVQIALSLQKCGQFESALDWYRVAYAYDLPLTTGPGGLSDNQRAVFYGLGMESANPGTYPQIPTWMVDASNPHQIAVYRTRPYTRFTILAIVQCLLDFADAQFATETSESISAALGLYINALDLLDQVPQIILADIVTDSNPQVGVMRQHAENNLLKLHTGRNIAGKLRAIEGAFSQPTAYQYSTLIDRAKQLVALAQQIEGTYLATLEKGDEEAYTALKAGQDLDTANATVRLQNLQVQEAADSVISAKDQVSKAQDQYNHYSQLLSQGLSDAENASLDMQYAKTGLEIVATIGSIIAAPYTGGASLSVAEQMGPQALSDATSAVSTGASYDRRAQDWQFQENQASDEIGIANQQVAVANDQKAVAGQELTIASKQADHDQAVVTFLATKFTNTELYRWMSGVLGRVYAYFLQQATAMARLAEDQLAFERQEQPLSFIQPDYWQPIANVNASTASSGQTPNSAGLTGAERLLQDITRVDQYAFQTDQLKLQITKSISLSQLDPFAFQRFCGTGVLRFATPMSLFDQDFPGHYVRLIKQVQVSVIALIPPSQGIRATLANHGISRVIIMNESGAFQSAIVQRDPQSVALSSPLNATGLFDLTTSSQSGMLLPFEDLGVDTSWEFVMPKAANPFDYTTVADVLLSINYTALDSQEYRLQVIQQLDQSVSADRAYSFQQQFPDAWYELNNPQQSPMPMVVQFQTEAQDFPPNLDRMTIGQLVLYFVPTNGASFAVQPSATLTLTGTDANGNSRTVRGTATAIDNVISTRRGNAPNWAPMIGMQTAGNWTLDLSSPLATNLFQNGTLQDVLFVVTYNGNTPPWPN
jgi:Tc toxin complex TcA C-terminal TcB-binding domain